MRLELIQHVDGAAEFLDTEPRADVQVAQLADAQSFEIGMKAGHRKIYFSDLKVGPVDDGAESGDGERGGGGGESRSVNQLAAAGRVLHCRIAGYRPPPVIHRE